jgi:hypothetical protein
MIRKQLELLRHGVEAQMRWVALHGGDQELLDLLRDESTRLSMMIGQYPSKRDAASTQQTPRPDGAPHCPKGRMIAPAGNGRQPNMKAIQLLSTIAIGLTVATPQDQSIRNTALPAIRRSRSSSRVLSRSRQLRSAPIWGLSDPSATSEASKVRSGVNSSSGPEAKE